MDIRSLWNLTDCTDTFSYWFLIIDMQLNTSKTEAMFTGTYKKLFKLGSISVKVDSVNIQSSSNLKLLGVTFDSKLSMNNQVSIVCCSCNYHIRVLWHIRASLSTETANKLASSIVHTRLDYCNSLYIGMAELTWTRLQVVQNWLTVCVVRTSTMIVTTIVLATCCHPYTGYQSNNGWSSNLESSHTRHWL